MASPAERIAENLARVREQIAAAEARAGRPAGSVKLVAVTKYVGPAEAAALVQAGCADLGESRPQELWRKAEALVHLPIRWHLIGHLQRNKVRRTLPHLALLHSGDSERLLSELDSAQFSRNAAGVRDDAIAKLPVLLEVNISGDADKHGFSPGELVALAPRLASFSHLEFRGLMAMASLSGGHERARADFAALRTLRDELRTHLPAEISLAELSMGMSGDFEVAIEEGATIVRIGSALFEGVAAE
jgi:pyridoxal phosphate enzyme (YggS family)